MAGIDDAPAAIDDDARHREPAERVGKRRGHGLDGGDLVRGALDVVHRLVHAPAHQGFEVEGFDDAHPLRGLEHDVEDAGHCTACFSGNYPINVPQWLFSEDRSKMVFEVR